MLSGSCYLFVYGAPKRSVLNNIYFRSERNYNWGPLKLQVPEQLCTSKETGLVPMATRVLEEKSSTADIYMYANLFVMQFFPLDSPFTFWAIKMRPEHVLDDSDRRVCHPASQIAINLLIVRRNFY